MNNTNLVSVIIAFLNEEKFLREAIDSVIQQDYEYWELLLIDDGSNDRSTEIAKGYAQQYPDKIFYLEHEGHINKGLSASRNLGILHAKGKFVAFLDADDVWRPGKLTLQISIFKQHTDIAMVAEASEYWYDWDNATYSNVIIPVGAINDRKYDPPQMLFHLYPLSKGAAPCPSGLMVTKTALARSGTFEESFTKEYGLYEDQAFLHKIYLKEKIFISSACNNLYRQRSQSIVAKVHAEGKYHKVREYFLKWLQQYLQKHEIKNIHVESLINKALLPYRHPFLYYTLYVAPIKGWRKLKNTFKPFLVAAK